MNPSYSPSEIAKTIGGRLIGGGDIEVVGVESVDRAGKQHAAWIARDEFAGALETSKAGVLLVRAGAHDLPAGRCIIECEKMDPAIAALLSMFAPMRPAIAPGVHVSAFIDPSAELEDGVSAGPGVFVGPGSKIRTGTILLPGTFIGQGVTVGANCRLGPGAFILDDSILGDRVVVESASVIGGLGFGFFTGETGPQRFPHIGNVILGDDVEIGSCSCVDRAKFGSTRVGRGTKIDNLVQVAHNISIGECCVIAAQVGLSGSFSMGDGCVLGGRTGAIDHVHLGNGVQLAGGHTIVTRDFPDGTILSGFPAQEHRAELKERAAMRRLPKLLDTVKQLVARVEQLEASADHRT